MDVFEVNFSTLGAAIQTFFRFVGAILSRQEGIIAEIHNQRGVLQLSLVMVLLAGLSEAIGQSLVLFVNQVSPRRMVISLILSAFLFVGGYVLWVLSIWLVAAILFRPDASILDVIRAVGLGYAPLLFGFLGLLPYFGVGALTLLYFWAFTAIVSAVGVALGLSTAQAILVSVGGGLLVLRVRATFGKPLVKFLRRVRNAAAGKRLVLKIQQAVEQRSLEVFDVLDDGEEARE
jgi:hypothetical protein